MGDAILDAAVVAGLEVQAIVFPFTAPVAPVQAVTGPEIQGAGDGVLPIVGQHHDHLLPEGRRDLGEEGLGQVTAMSAAFGVGVLVKTVELAPLPGPYLVALQGSQGQSLLRHPGAFPPQALALAAGETRQEIVETGIALVEPVELGGHALRQAAFSQTLAHFPLWKEQMPGGDVLPPGEVLDGLQCGAPRGVFVDPRPGKQARAGGGCERYGAHQFRVVAQAAALPGIRPGPVKHVLAIGVRLEVQRHEGEDAERVPQHQVAWLPTGCGGGAAAVFQAVQEFMAQERVVAAADGVPAGCGNLFQAGDKLDGRAHAGAPVSSN